MRRRRKYLIAAATVVAVVTVVVVAVSVSQSPTVHAATMPVVDQVPSTVPEGGVTMLEGVADITLTPIGAAAEGGSLMSSEDAVAHAPKVDLPAPPAAVLANVTIGSTIPLEGESVRGYRNVQNRPAWVITYTYPEPTDVRIGKYVGPKDNAVSPSPIMVTHFNVIIDAESGDFLLGFFTK